MCDIIDELYNAETKYLLELAEILSEEDMNKVHNLSSVMYKQGRLSVYNANGWDMDDAL